MVFLLPTTKLQLGNVFTRVCDSVHRGVSVQWGLCLEGLCPGVSVHWVSVWGSLSRPAVRLCVGCKGGGISVHTRCTVMCGRYASYWNAFLLDIHPSSTRKISGDLLHYSSLKFVELVNWPFPLNFYRAPMKLGEGHVSHFLSGWWVSLVPGPFRGWGGYVQGWVDTQGMGPE